MRGRWSPTSPPCEAVTRRPCERDGGGLAARRVVDFPCLAAGLHGPSAHASARLGEKDYRPTLITSVGNRAWPDGGASGLMG